MLHESENGKRVGALRLKKCERSIRKMQSKQGLLPKKAFRVLETFDKELKSR